jgi:hypothetical protein
MRLRSCQTISLRPLRRLEAAYAGVPPGAGLRRRVAVAVARRRRASLGAGPDR